MSNNNNMMNMNILNMINMMMNINNNNNSMMNNNNMMNMDINMNKEQKNNNLLSSIISKMQNLKENISKQMNMSNSLQKLLNLLNMNISIMGCIRESHDIIYNNRLLMRDLIDNLSGNNIKNKDSVRVCLNNKMEKFLNDKNKANNNNDIIPQIIYKFYEHEDEYEHCILKFINRNIELKNNDYIYNAVFEDRNSKQFILYCNIEEKLDDLFKRYKMIKGCTGKNYKFIFNMRTISPELMIKQSGLFNGGFISPPIRAVELN